MTEPVSQVDVRSISSRTHTPLFSIYTRSQVDVRSISSRTTSFLCAET